MPIIASDKSGVFHLVPSGTMQAVCFAVWDLGLQVNEFQGKKIVQHKIMVGWETAERIDSNDEWDKQRYRIYKKYTLSLNDKATLCKDLISWRGKPFTDEEKKGFDVESLVGENCFLNIVHNESNGKIFANVRAVTTLVKGIPAITPENKTLEPEWIIKLQSAAVSEDVAAEIREAAKEAAEDSDTPF